MTESAVASGAEGRAGSGTDLASIVASGCRVLAGKGYEDLTLGHLSARESGGAAIYMKRKGLALGEVERQDVIELDLGGNPVSADVDLVHLEAVIHTEIYRARPDVGAIVHGHPPHATALAATDVDLELLTHDAVLFADGVGWFESSDLITAPSQGVGVAEALGDKRAVLLRNHGVVCVGKDVPWAVLTAITLERSCRLQLVASTLGRLEPIPRDEARRLAPVKYRDGLVQEYWNAWLRQVDSGDAPA